MRPTRLVLGGALALTGALLLVACSAGGESAQSMPPSSSASSEAGTGSGLGPSNGPSGGASGRPAPALSPAASPVLDAVALTRAAGSAKVTVKSTSSLGKGEPWLNIGDGEVDLSKGLGRIAFDSSNGRTSDLLVNQDSSYVSSDGGKNWYFLTFQQTTPLMGSINVLRLLGQVEWSSGAPDTVKGTPLTRYDGSVVDPQLPDALDGMGISTEDPLTLSQASGLVIDISVWVDDEGRIVQILRTVSADTPQGALGATELTTLSNFGGSIDISSPPANRVQPAPEN